MAHLAGAEANRTTVDSERDVQWLETLLKAMTCLLLTNLPYKFPITDSIYVTVTAPPRAPAFDFENLFLILRGLWTIEGGPSLRLCSGQVFAVLVFAKGGIRGCRRHISHEQRVAPTHPSTRKIGARRGPRTALGIPGRTFPMVTSLRDSTIG